MTDLADSLPPLPASPVPSEPVVLADYLPQEKPVLIPRAERHLKFYLDFVTFEVEDRLFMVPKYQFTQRSTKFVADFLGPTVDEQTPIKLEGVEKADFQALLSLMYPLPNELSSRWFMLDLRKMAIDALSFLPPIRKIVLAREYSVHHWLLDGYRHLVSRAETLSVDDAKAIGLEATLKIVNLRQEPLQRNRPNISSRGQTAQSASNPFISTVDDEFAEELRQIRGESRSSAVERVKVAKKYKLAEWLSAAYSELAERREALSLHEVKQLGLETSIILCRARERSLRSCGQSAGYSHFGFLYHMPATVEQSFNEELKGVQVAGEQYSPPALAVTLDTASHSRRGRGGPARRARHW